MRIPRHIYQTYVQRTPFMASWQQQPGWQHHFFDDVACRRFVQQHLGPTVYAAYMRLTPGAARADLWRYCVLWVRGGIYADADCRCLVPLDEWVGAETQLLVPVDHEHKPALGLFQAVLACTPAHPVMRALLRAADLPLAAPSANRSGLTSPSTAAHVLASLDGRIEAVLDGGPCERGIESTIVGLKSDGWSLLRPGPITAQQIAEVLGLGAAPSGEGIEAPGQLPQHYSPGKPVRLNVITAEADEYLIGFGAVAGACNLSTNGDLAEAAARLYACLHEAARSGLPRVAVAPVPDEGIGAAIKGRLRRAAS